MSISPWVTTFITPTTCLIMHSTMKLDVDQPHWWTINFSKFLKMGSLHYLVFEFTLTMVRVNYIALTLKTYMIFRGHVSGHSTT